MMWPMSYALAPTSWPITVRLRVSVPPEQPLAWPAVKQPAAPHGPFGSVICAAVSRLRRSFSAISTIEIAVSSS